MAIYTIADLHLAHSVNKPMNRFGARWANHTEKLEKRWCAVVEDGDTVVIPGDISWAMTLEEAAEDLRFIDRLPGKKLISRGNHDYWWTSASKIKAFFEANGITTIDILQNNAYSVGEYILAGSRGWYIEPRLQNTQSPTDYEKIVARECVRLGLSLDEAELLKNEHPSAKTVVFLHFPPVFGDFICRPIIEVMKSRGVGECYFGHIHGVYNVPSTVDFEGIRLHMISADYLDFYPCKIIPDLHRTLSIHSL